MAAYRLPYRYRRYYVRSRYGTMSPSKALGLGLGAAVALAAAGQGAVHAAHHRGPVAGESAVVAQAIGYARHRLGLPYCWGGTGPSCYDCSGLVMEAYASAGVSIPRTSQAQWAALRHVPAGNRRAGDLVLAPGSDGSWASPGHVGLLIGRNTVIQAYATGYPLDQVSLASFASGAGGIVGYARPGGA